MYNIPTLNMSAHNVGVSYAMNVKRYGHMIVVLL